MIELAGSRYPDDDIRDYFADAYEQWAEDAGDPASGVFDLPVAPDRLTKDNVSGGPPYGIRLPDAGAEGIFVGEVAMPFVSYLNRVFTGGGFFGPQLPPWQIRQALTDGLLGL